MDPTTPPQVHFDPSSLHAINAALGLVLFGIALDMRFSDFKRVVTAGKAALIGLAAMVVLLPALTYVLVLGLNPPPAVALGLMLVAACPGGAASNFLTHHARGDTALSVAMTSVSTAASFIVTPFNFAFWGGMHPGSRELLREISLDPIEMALTVILILGLPLAAGMTLATWLPKIAQRMRKPLNTLSLIVFAIIVVAAIGANYKAFLPHVGGVAGLVFVVNACGLLLGYYIAKMFGLGEPERRAISLEVGMHNTTLGLVLIFNHFGGNGGMAIIAAWWGIWHLISGFALATWWRRRPTQP